MEAYCIALERNKYKWNEILNKIRNNGFSNVQIFPAVDGQDIKKGLYNSMREWGRDEILSVWAKYNLVYSLGRRCHEQFGSWGAVGCYMSHISIWKDIVDRNINECIIFEEDVQFNDNFIENWKITQEHMPSDYGLIMLGVSWNQEGEVYNQYFEKIKKQFFGLHAYIITRDAAKKLLANIFPAEIQIDSYISFYSRLNMGTENEINLYKCHGLVYQHLINPSSIQTPCVICMTGEKHIRITNIITFIFIFVLIALLIKFLFKRTKRIIKRV